MAKRERSGARDEGRDGSPNGAVDFLSVARSLTAARRAAAACRGCALYRHATQTVFGEGAARARIMLVGETPGKRRLHKRPLQSEIAACMPWLRMELELVRPAIVVCLGSTGQALLGKGFSVTRERGRLLESPHAPLVMATLHPSAFLRIRESAERHAAFERFVTDLKLVHTAEPVHA